MNRLNTPMHDASADASSGRASSLLSLEPAFKAVAAATRGSEADGMPAGTAVAALRSSGAMEAIIACDHGGQGLGCDAANAILAQLAESDASLAILLYIHYGVVLRVADCGDASQHGAYLRAAAAGNHIMAAAWSETGAGAGKANIATEAVLSPDNTWVLTGHKTWTTGTGLADVYLVLARLTGATAPSDGEQGAYGAADQGLFLVESDRAGVTSHGALDLVGMSSSATGSISFDRCEVPAEALLAAPGLTPTIMRHPQQRGLTLGAVCVGIAQRAVRVARQHMETKRTFDRDVQRERLFRMTARVEAMRALVAEVSEADSRAGELSLIAKVVGSEGAEAVCRDAQRIVGADSLMASQPLAVMQQDARAVGLMGPPNDLCRDLVTRAWFT